MSLSILKINFHQILLFSFGITLIGCDTSPEARQMPNIIFVLADDLGYGDISAFNENSKITTTHTDQLANEGMIFTDAHTTSSVCTPTRYSLLTGRYNWRSRLKNRVLTGKSRALIPNQRKTVASILKEKGYRTNFIGKWHLGWDWALKDPENRQGEGWDPKDFENIDFSKPVTNTPNDLGFDYAYGHSGSLDMAPYVYVENSRVTAIPDTVTVNKGRYSWWREGPTSPDFDHEDVTPNFFRRAINVVTEQSKNDQPYFLYLALPSPHTPILPSEEWQEKSGLNPYADFMLMIDNYIGQLTKSIKASGEEDNTLIIFASDNGVSPAVKLEELTSKDHFSSYIFRGHKADIFEGGHRVPFIVKWPNRIPPNSKNNVTVSIMDFMSTCADIVSYKLGENDAEDSFSLLPLFEQKKEQFKRKSTIHHSINGSFAIRKDEWKLIMCPGSGGWSEPKPNNSDAIDTLPPFQLYNLAEDPAEERNVASDNPLVVKDLQKILKETILNGRSTEGLAQSNDTIDGNWNQLDKMMELMID